MITDIKPADFAPSLNVVSCYVMRSGRFILLQRNPQKWQPLKWGVVAGRSEPGETEVEAVIRELKEEVGVQAKPEDLRYREALFVRSDDPKDPFDIVYHVFEMDVPDETEIRISPEHVDARWVTSDEVLQIDLIHDLDACIQRHF